MILLFVCIFLVHIPVLRLTLLLFELIPWLGTMITYLHKCMSLIQIHGYRNRNHMAGIAGPRKGLCGKTFFTDFGWLEKGDLMVRTAGVWAVSVPIEF